MALDNGEKGTRKGTHARRGLEIHIKEKTKEFLSAEREYCKQRDALRKSMEETLEALPLKAGIVLPEHISSTVWGLRDGVAFVRHKSVSGEPTFQFRNLPIALEEWAKTGFVVSVGGDEISLARAGLIKSLEPVTLIDCPIGDAQIPYAEFAHVRHGDDTHISSAKRVFVNFQLSFLGLQTQQIPEEAERPGCLSAETTMARLQEIAQEFQELLQGDQEEAILQFLKEHPFVLHQSAERIPRERLGEDFITDFVLIATTTQGPAYTFVVLERPGHLVIRKDFTLTSPANHSIKQTRNWDVWLEKNQACVENRLTGFTIPRYMVVIGRSNEFNEDQRAYMRSYNRGWKNLELLTYDEVLARFQQTIQRLLETVAK